MIYRLELVHYPTRDAIVNGVGRTLRTFELKPSGSSMGYFDIHNDEDVRKLIESLQETQREEAATKRVF